MGCGQASHAGINHTSCCVCGSVASAKGSSTDSRQIRLIIQQTRLSTPTSAVSGSRNCIKPQPAERLSHSSNPAIASARGARIALFCSATLWAADREVFQGRHRDVQWLWVCRKVERLKLWWGKALVGQRNMTGTAIQHLLRTVSKTSLKFIQLH